MKIQSINPQNNISNKAFFKKNEALEFLYKKAKKTEKLVQISKDLRKMTPSHELEITKIYKNENLIENSVYEIVNNTTEKFVRIFANNDENGLIMILSHLNLFRDSDFFKFDEKETDIDCLDILTNKD